MPQTTHGRKTATALGYRRGYANGLRQGLRKGRQKGIGEGRKKGVLEGMHRLILRQIRRRIGATPATVERRIKAIADTKALERIAAGLLEPIDRAQLKALVARGRKAARPRNGRATRGFPARREGPADAVSRRRPRRMSPLRHSH